MLRRAFVRGVAGTLGGARALGSGRSLVVDGAQSVPALVAREGRVLSRGFLLQQVWGYAPDVTSRTVDWHIVALRRRLGKMGQRLATVRGTGYCWQGG